MLNGNDVAGRAAPACRRAQRGIRAHDRDYFACHRVKRGLTSWAQVNGFRGETKTLEHVEVRVQYDSYYVENWSLFFDLKILATTAQNSPTGRNAY